MSSTRISGIYIPVEFSYTELEKSLKVAQQKVTEQSHKMADAIAGALSPQQIQRNVHSMVNDLSKLVQGTKATGDGFKKIGVDLGELRSLTGLSETAFRSLQQRLLQTHAATAAEGAFRRIAKSAQLSREEIATFGKQFSLSEGQIDRVTAALYKTAAAIKSLPAIPQYTTLASAGQTSLNTQSAAQTSGFARDLVAMSGGADIARKSVDLLKIDMDALSRSTGLTSERISELKARFAARSGEKIQETALLNIAKSADLAEKEIRELGRQFNMSEASINRTVDSMNKVGKSTEFSMAKFRDMILTVGIYTVAFQSLSAVLGGIRAEFMAGLKSVEDFGTSVASSTALITTFSQRAKSGDIAGAYLEANAYATKLVETLEMIDTKTIANSAHLQAMSETFIANGVLLNTSNQKQIEGFTSVANALAIMTKGQNQDIQMRQEIRGLLDGQIRQEDKLGMMLKSRIPDIERQIKAWQRDGEVLENLGKLLEGFNATTGLLEDQWATVGSTMETIHTRILRGMFEPVFKDLIDLAKELNRTLMDMDGNLTAFARGMVKIVNNTYDAIKQAKQDVANSLVSNMTPLGLGMKAVKAELGWLGEAVADYGSTKVEKAKKDIQEIEQSLKGVEEWGQKWYQVSIFKDSDEDIVKKKQKLADLYSFVRNQENELAREKGRAGTIEAPKLAPPPGGKEYENFIKYIKTEREKAKEEYETMLTFAKTAEERARVLAKYKEELAKIDKRESSGRGSELRREVSLREKIADMEKSANKVSIADARNTRKIELQIAENKYEGQIISLADYIKKKQSLELAAAEEEVRLNQDTVAAYEAVLAGKFSAGTRGMTERAEAAEELNKAIEKLRNSEADLTVVQLKSLGETARYRREEKDFVRSIQIQYAQFAGSFLKAERLRQESIEYTTTLLRLQQDVIDKIAGAQEALANFKAQGAADLRGAKTADERYRRDVDGSKFGEGNEFDSIVQKYQDMYDRIRDVEDQFGKTSLEATNLRLGSMVDMTRDAFATIADVMMSGNKSQFEAGKAIAMAMAVVNGALAVTKAMTTMAPPMSFIMAGMVGAAVGVQLAKISSTQYQGRAAGGPVYAGQTYIVNENRKTEGPEYFTPSVSGTITPAPKMRGGTVNQVINIQGSIDRRTATQLSNDAARRQRIAQLRFG